MDHYYSGQGIGAARYPWRRGTASLERLHQHLADGALNYLAKLSIRNTDHEHDAHGQAVLHVRDPHALIQASGYLKFIRAKEGEAIFFRGQTQTYSTLSPTLFRKIGPTQGAQAAIVQKRNATPSAAARD